MPYKNKEDQLACRRRHYYRNKQEYFDRNALARKRKREYIKKLLEDGACKRCGNEDTRVLIFHHRIPEEKFREISKMHTCSWKKLYEELDKCEVICRNCHAIVHHEMRVLGGPRAFNPEIVEGSSPSMRSNFAGIPRRTEEFQLRRHGGSIPLARANFVR